jgi:hypothetical protein
LKDIGKEMNRKLPHHQAKNSINKHHIMNIKFKLNPDNIL